MNYLLDICQHANGTEKEPLTFQRLVEQGVSMTSADYLLERYKLRDSFAMFLFIVSH